MRDCLLLPVADVSLKAFPALYASETLESRTERVSAYRQCLQAFNSKYQVRHAAVLLIQSFTSHVKAHMYVCMLA